MSELKKLGYKIVSYKELLINKGPLYPNLVSGLNLREEPKESSKKILLIKNIRNSKYFYSIEPSAKTEGLWVYVTVRKLTGTGDCGSEIVLGIKGG